jgi:ribosome biogenesis GTPase
LTHQEREFHKCAEEKRRRRERRGCEAGSTKVQLDEAQVSAVWARECEVIARGGRRRVRTRGLEPAPGDRVLFSSRGLEGILPRRTVLARTEAGRAGGERILAANIDIVVVVASFSEPPLRPGLIDRYLVAVRRGGAEPLLCVNKADLATPTERLLATPYEALGLPVLVCSARTGSGLAALRARIGGKLCVVTGHSGTGKSSLVNALAPELDLRAGAVSGSGKGRHTTTSSALYELQNGIRIIDTPGIREFGVRLAEPAEIPEFTKYAGRCRFRDCTHTHEPRCAVKDAVASGRIPSRRYESYLRMLGFA